MEKYTTADIVAKIDVKDVEALKSEQAKTIISNDAYSVIETMERLRLAFLK